MALVSGVWVSTVKAEDLREGDLFIFDGDFTEQCSGEHAKELVKIVEELKDPDSHRSTKIVSIERYPEERMITVWTAAWGTDLYEDDFVDAVRRRLNPGFC